MQYISTRGGISPVNFTDAVMMGLATDGGLLLPEQIPDARSSMSQWRDLSYQKLAFEVMKMFVGDSISPEKLRDIITRSYATFTHPDVAPIVTVGECHIMELFHGPTFAFKDVALQFLGNVFEHILKQENRTLNILGATSGDTGSAAIYGVRGRSGINIFILHPHQRVSPVQERQMTSVLDDNVYNIAIEGSFDDGQRIIKDLFGDLDFKHQYQLGAVNSVNWCRVMAQIVYYFYGAFTVCRNTGADTIRVTVPTGNFGNIFAAYVACRMGAPIHQLVLATNENDILRRFFATGVYSRGNVVPTLSPSMDIQVASNFERYLYYQVGEDAAAIKEMMAQFAESAKLQLPVGEKGVDPLFRAGTGNTADTLATIKRLYEEAEYVIDPHSAVGVAVADGIPKDEHPMLCVATAHPAKFGDAITQALGQPLGTHPSIDKLSDLPTRCEVLPATNAAIRDYMVGVLS